MPCGRRRSDFVELKLACNFVDHVGRNWPELFHKTADQGVLTKQIDHARNALSIFVDSV